MEIQKEFSIKDRNGQEVIVVKLIDNASHIYLNGEFFRLCTKIPIVPREADLPNFQEIESINDIIDYLDRSDEGKGPKIDPELIFFVLCSNLQAWVEHDYDTTLLGYWLSFPLLKELANSGNQLALQRFKEEILKRYLQSTKKIRYFLIKRKYLDYFNEEERFHFYQNVLRKKEALAIYQLEKIIGKGFILLDHAVEERRDGMVPLEIYTKTNVLIEIKDKKVIGLQILECPTPEVWNIIRDLPDLERLYLSGKIKFIPEWINELASLKYLEIHHSAVARIPESLGNMNHLIGLDLNDNKISEIPGFMGNLKKLQFLNISHNKYDALPEELLNLSELMEIEYDKVSNLPEDFDHLIRTYMENRGYIEERTINFVGDVEKRWSKSSSGYTDIFDNRSTADPLGWLIENIFRRHPDLKEFESFIREEIIPEIVQFSRAKKKVYKNLFVEFYEKKLYGFIRNPNLLGESHASQREVNESLRKELTKFLNKQADWVRKVTQKKRT